MKQELDLYQRTLSVRLIATDRADFACCEPQELLSDVLSRNVDDEFDHLPVREGEEIIGVLDTVANLDAGHCLVRERMQKINESLLIGSDASILEFLEHADERPFQFLITATGIGGLVSFSDVQKLPVRASLFALITQLEIALIDSIRRRYSGTEWRNALCAKRLKTLDKWFGKARKERIDVDELLYTGFGDKAEIVATYIVEISPEKSKEEFMDGFKRFKQVRDKLAHSADFMGSRSNPSICPLVREMNSWVDRLSPQ